MVEEQGSRTVRRPNEVRAGSARTTRRSRRGFTLVELMIVISIIFILIGMAAAAYTHHVRLAREAVLKQDLQTMRSAIDAFTMDKLQAPQSLQELVDAHYLRDIPVDPFTNQKDWVTHFGTTLLSPEQSGVGLDDVHSNSDQSGTDGTAYNTW